MASVQRSARSGLISVHSWKILQLKASKGLDKPYNAFLLAKELTGAGLFASAMQTMRVVDRCRTPQVIMIQASTFERIAREMHKAGCEKGKVFNAFVRELKVIRDIMEPSVQHLAAENAFYAMRHSRFTIPEIKKAFEQSRCEELFVHCRKAKIRLIYHNGKLV